MTSYRLSKVTFALGCTV